MKKQLFLSLILAAVAVTALAFTFNQKNMEDPPVIGTIDGDIYTITYDLELMKSQWESILATGGVSANLSDFQIIFDSENSVYLLRANDVNADLKCAVTLEDSGSGNLTELLTSGGGLTVTCTGCAYACDPKIVGERSYCSPPCDADDPKGCTKSSTLSADTGIFVN